MELKDILYIVGQFFGVVAIILGFLTFQVKTQKRLLICQIGVCIVFSLHYLLIGAYTGMAMNAVNVVRNCFYYRRNQKGDNSLFIPIFFTLILAVIGILTWDHWYSAFIFFALVINSMCMAFSDPQSVRKSILVTSPMAVIYNIFTLSLGGFVYESVAIISSIIGIVRHGKKKD